MVWCCLMITKTGKARLLSGIAVTLGAMLFGACTPDGTTSLDSSPTGPLETSGNQGIGNDTTAAPVEWTPSPLEEFTSRIQGWEIPGTPENAAQVQARLNRQSLERGEIIAACMAEQGFTYQLDPSAAAGIVFSDYDGPTWGTREFAESYGFGLSTDPWGLADVELADDDYTLVGADTATGTTLAGVYVSALDLNAEQLAAMSDAERAAWDDALWGIYAAPQEGEIWDPTLAGCWGAAEIALGAGVTPDQFQALETEMAQLWQQIENDPRFAALNMEWGICLTEAGFPGFTSEIALHEQLRTEVLALTAGDAAAFREREIAIALADFDCREQTDFVATQTAISHGLQQQFVDRNRAKLEAWASYMEQQRG